MTAVVIAQMNNQALRSRHRNPTWMSGYSFSLLIDFGEWAETIVRGARQHYKKGVELLEKQQLEPQLRNCLQPPS